VNDVRNVTEKVVTLRKEGRYEDAELMLREAINENENNWELWNQLGHVLVATKNYAQAAPAFETATQLNPNGFWLWLSLGYSRKENAQIDGAIEATLQATKLSTKPNEIGSALYNLGCFNCLAGRHDEAIDYLDQAFQIDESIREWAHDDSDLESLKTDERFLRILKSG
jgi:tetratricopeptide (TPR) repeat protein